MNEEAALRGKVELGRGFQLSPEHLPRSHVRIPAQGCLRIAIRFLSQSNLGIPQKKA